MEKEIPLPPISLLSWLWSLNVIDAGTINKDIPGIGRQYTVEKKKLFSTATLKRYTWRNDIIYLLLLRSNDLDTLDLFVPNKSQLTDNNSIKCPKRQFCKLK